MKRNINYQAQVLKCIFFKPIFNFKKEVLQPSSELLIALAPVAGLFLTYFFSKCIESEKSDFLSLNKSMTVESKKKIHELMPFLPVYFSQRLEKEKKPTSAY